MRNIRKPTVRYSHLLITLALLGRLCAAELAQAESFACADIIRGVREKMEVSIEEGSPQDALEVLVALSPIIEVACEEQSSALSPGGSSAFLSEVDEPTATVASGSSKACKEAKEAFAEMRLALDRAERELNLLIAEIKQKQDEWDKKELILMKRIRTVQKYEDSVYKELLSLRKAQNDLAYDLIKKKNTRNATQQKVNRLSNLLKRLMDKKEDACR